MHEHDNVAIIIITDDWGGEHISITWPHVQDHHCWGKDIPTVVNLDNAAEEGFDQYRYVLPR